MTVYVLMHVVPYEGGTLLGAYSSEAKAQEAEAQFRDEPHSVSDSDDVLAYPVEVDAAPRWRFEP